MNNSLVYGVIGLVAGVVIGFFIFSGKTETTNTQPAQQESMTMDHSGNSLSGKMGDDFDKAFISEMIIHHQGAIDMAKQASASAKHQEIKDLSKAIIDAQALEINQMNDWQKEWGY